MKISLVVAASTNNAIGKENKLLWHLPNDMKFFKNVTWGLPVAYGRKTWDALQGKPLNGRLNIVISRQSNFAAEGAIVVHDISDATKLAKQHDYKELMIIGGGEIYTQSMINADRIYITRVHHIFDDADAFFPTIDTNHWVLVSNQDFFTDEKHAYSYSFQVWDRK